MDEDQLVSEINQVLRAKWSKKQTSMGKWIEVQWSWAGIIGKTVHKYKECGWIVKKQVELGPTGRRVWLIFMNPNWLGKNGKIRDHLPY